MGKCRIISHDGDGLYTVDLLPDFTLIEADIARIEAKLLDIDNVELMNLQIAYNEKAAASDASLSVLNGTISTYIADPTSVNYKAVTDQMTVYHKALQEEYTAKVPLEAVKARKLALQKRKARLEDSMVDPAPIQVWCADLSDGLDFRNIYNVDDEAGTIELVGEDANGINLQPQYADNGAHSSTRDGLSTPTAALTPASYFYNRAMLPGWQRWKCAYRPGVITGATVGGGFDITLDDVKSAEQNPFIPVGDIAGNGGTLTGIHAQYMNCNDAAFTAGDHVIVESAYDLAGVRTDQIIGFVDNPKPCDINGFNYHPQVVGGTQPGYHDWQNVQPAAAPTYWIMNTPVTTDLIADAGTSDIEDWKGYLSDGRKMLVQWIYDGDYIYVNGIKVARAPTFSLSAVAGDTAQVPSGINTAWVTDDGAYLYAIAVTSNKSRHILRKTLEIELTGGAYNAGTLPDGWETDGPYGATPLADFTSWGRVYVNQSGDEGRSMDQWVHGAKRTPQLSPGSGAVWNADLGSYDNAWSEESQFSITTPKASTLAGAGVSYQFNGLIGGYLYWQLDTSSYSYRTGNFICYASDSWIEGHRTDTWDEAYSGAYAIAVGYNVDTVGYLYMKGEGTYSLETNYDNYQTCQTGCTGPDQSVERKEADAASTSTATGYGIFYDPDFVTWKIPHRLTIVDNEVTSMVAAAAACDYILCENVTYQQDLERTLVFGVMDKANVGDAMYRWYGSDAYHLTDIDMVNDTNCDEGVRYQEDLIRDTGKVRLGDTEFNYSKNTTDTSGTTDPFNPQIPFAAWEVLTGTYDSGDDPKVTIDTSSSVKTNVTGLSGTLLTITNRFATTQGARDHNGNYINSHTHTYNAGATLEYVDHLTNGDLDTLNELDDGTGVIYRAPHVAN